jgi:translation initiation factor 4G
MTNCIESSPHSINTKDSAPATYVHTTDVLLKYRDLNKRGHPNFEKYYSDTIQNKIRKIGGLDILDKQDIRVKLNYIITKKNVSNEDDNLYSIVRYNLNKVNNKMLIEGSDNGLQATINSLTSLPYSKVEHFQKLAEMVIDKAVNEQKFCPIYATLCYELSPYYIELNQNSRVYFRRVLLNTCQITFESFLNNCEKIEKEKLSGLMNILGELFNRKLLTSVIIKGCFDRLSNTLEKSNNSADGVATLVIATYRNLLKENPEICKYFNEKLNKYVDNAKLHIRSKFAIQNALDKIQEINQS